MALVTETIYIEAATDLKNRLTRICAIIETLETRMVEAGAGDSNISEYRLDDGQVKIQTLYRSPESIAKAIIMYERIKTKIINQLNGRNMVLRDARGMC